MNGKPQIIRPGADNSASWPAGSIFSSAIDLSRWVAAFVSGGMLDGKQVLPAALFSTLTTPNTTIPGSANKYGYGVQMGHWRGLEVVAHGGSRSGYGSTIRMVPSRRFGVVVLANRTGVELSRTADAVMEAALKPPAAVTSSKPVPRPTDEAERARFVGTYSQGPRQMTIETKGDQLIVRQQGVEMPLQRIGDLEFTAGEQRIVLVADADGAVAFLHAGGRSWRKVK